MYYTNIYSNRNGERQWLVTVTMLLQANSSDIDPVPMEEIKIEATEDREDGKKTSFKEKTAGIGFFGRFLICFLFLLVCILDDTLVDLDRMVLVVLLEVILKNS